MPGFLTGAMKAAKGIGAAFKADASALKGGWKGLRGASRGITGAAAAGAHPGTTGEMISKMSKGFMGNAENTAKVTRAGKHLGVAAGVAGAGGLGYVAGKRTNPTRGGRSFSLGGHTLAFK